MPVERRGVSVVQNGSKVVRKVETGSVSVAPKSKPGRSGVGIYLLDEVNKNGWRVIFLPLKKTTWVKRCPSEDDTCDLDSEKVKKCDSLTDTQKEKLTYFFAHVFDMDRDDIIALQDFEGFTEEGRFMCSRRLKFVLKSLNNLFEESYGLQDALDDIQISCKDSEDSGSFQSTGAILAWLNDPKPERLGRIMEEEPKLSGENQGPKELDRLFLGLEEWLVVWGDILGTKKNFYDLPLWLQFLPKVLFTAINRSGTGRVTKEELGSFYSSVMGYPGQKLNDLLNEAYTAMTAGGDFKLTYDCYRLCFANFLFGRHPNGPGQYIFGAAQRAPPPLFPIDYSAMNSSQEDIERYDGSLKSNRSSIIV